jgi:protein O-GlcNAc transferase
MPEMTLEQACRLAQELYGAGRLAEAKSVCRQVYQLQPDRADILGLLGLIAIQVGHNQVAEDLLRRAIAADPADASFHYNLGNICQNTGRLDEAIRCYQQALAIDPANADIRNNLGNALWSSGRVDEAVQSYQQALAIQPDYAEIHGNLANALRNQGRIDEAMRCYRHALATKPGSVLVHSALLYALPFHPDYDDASIYTEHRLWNERHALPLRGSIRPHGNDRNPERPLCIGYVSSDFREHPVGRFLLPLLENHDRRNFRVCCYSGVQRTDEFTSRLRACADCWRMTSGLPDAQLADLIRQDGTDILVDLTLHMAGSRLSVFARKPAPVQVTYLGYCGTTGLDAIDYRITDPYLDPPGTQQHYSERSAYLPRTYWCYQAPPNAPEPGPLPALATGHITFGCLNNFCKISPPSLAAWCRLLRDVPDSRLLLHSLEGSHRQRVRDVLSGQGIDPQRLDFVAHQPLQQYLDAYHRIDIALDPFPYNGGTTTCDALWMGVPVVSLAGRAAMGRAGLSILSNVGLPELVARDADNYGRIATELACDLPCLVELRSTLRQRMLASPLMDAPAFARDMETAYRTMWRAWCAKGDQPCQR